MSTLLGSERPEGAMRKEVASGILKGVGDNAPIEMATINRIGHLENDALRAANSTYSPLYCDYEFWLQRMQGFDGIGSIALAAEVDETWAGGFFAYPVPMRGPRGEPVRGCKLEGLVVLEEHRGKKYLFDGGTYEKISVRLSKAILKECFLEGYQIIFGCPNLLANPVHKRAGHGFVDLTSYRLSYCLQFRGWHRTNGKQRLARFGVFLGNRILSLLKKGVDQVGVITEASGFTTEMDDLDDLVAVRMPGIRPARTTAFLNWRFRSDRYIRLEARDGECGLRGYLVGTRCNGIDTAELIDFVVDLDAPEHVFDLLSAYIRHASENNASEIRVSSVGSGPLARFQRWALIRMGFVPIRRETRHWLVDGGNGYTTQDLQAPHLWAGGGICYDSP